MAVKMVAKVDLTTMVPKILYPQDGASEERIALLTGVVQLVSAALERTGDIDDGDCTPNFMKSDRGVIGYCKQYTTVIICEGDGEAETADALRAAIKSMGSSDSEIIDKLDKSIRKRGKEIGDLWK